MPMPAVLRRSRVRISCLASLALLAGLLTLPGAAEGSVASRSGDVITITGGPGEANNIRFEGECCFYDARITDTATVTAGAGCDQVSATEVTCGSSNPDTPDVVVRLGDGNDSFDPFSGVRNVDVDGGSGDDVVAGSSGNDVVHGGEGNDSVEGSSDDDQVFGDGGDDVVRGGSHADAVSGGPGRDQIDGDGSGFGSNNGSDTIDSRDGETDTVACGFGADTVIADSVDVIEASCEGVDSAGPAPGPPPPPGPGSAPATPLSIGLTVGSRGSIAALVSRSGFEFEVSVTAPCRATARITVAARDARRLKLGRRGVRIAAATVALSEAGVYEARLAAARRFRAKLRRLRRVPTTLSFSCSSSEETRRTSRRVTFSRSNRLSG